PLPDLREINADGFERFGLLRAERRGWPPSHDAHDFAFDVMGVDAEFSEDFACDAPLLTGQSEDQVFFAKVVVAKTDRLLLGADDGLSRRCREVLEHQARLDSRDRLRAYFLCTACRLTPRCSAIFCQDQPSPRAFCTWRASSCSSSLRRAATARRPVRGSLLAADVANSVAFDMLSS